MDTTDFGPVKPSVQPYLNGYSVPVALKQVERPGSDDGVVAHSWQGYLLMVPFLSELELDAAIAALTAAVHEARRAAYPPIEEYIDGVVKGDDAQMAAYKAKCIEVKKQHPLPTAS